MVNKIIRNKTTSAFLLALVMAMLVGVPKVDALSFNMQPKETRTIGANWTVSGDIEIIGVKKFYDGRGTPVVVFFCQDTPNVYAEWGASGVDITDTRPEVLAQRNNAVLQTYPAGCQPPPTVTQLFNQPAPVAPVAVVAIRPALVPPAAAVPVVQVASRPTPAQPAPVVILPPAAPARGQTPYAVGQVILPTTSGPPCLPIRPGALTPAIVIKKANNLQGYEILCGALPNFVCPTAWSNVDIPVLAGTTVTLPACMVANADLVWRGVPQYLGGANGEATDMEIAFPNGGTFYAAYDGDAYPGGPREAFIRCIAKFMEGSKTYCMIIDPPGDDEEWIPDDQPTTAQPAVVLTMLSYFDRREEIYAQVHDLAA